MTNDPMRKEARLRLFFILSGATRPLHKLPKPAPVKRENNKTERDKTGWPRKSPNRWMKEISINMNPIPIKKNKTTNLIKAGVSAAFGLSFLTKGKNRVNRHIAADGQKTSQMAFGIPFSILYKKERSSVT